MIISMKTFTVDFLSVTYMARGSLFYQFVWRARDFPYYEIKSCSLASTATYQQSVARNKREVQTKLVVSETQTDVESKGNFLNE